MWEWILSTRIWDNGGRNMRLNQAKFIDRDSPSKKSAFSAAVRCVCKGSNRLLV